MPCLLALLPLCLTGCGAGFQGASSGVSGVPNAAIAGTAMGGQQPVAFGQVTVYSMGNSGYGSGAVAMASTTTDANGNFSFPANAYSCLYSGTPMYITAVGGNPGGGPNANLALIAAVGPCSEAKSAHVILNEVTTAATVTALGQFMGTTLGAGGTANIIGGPCDASCSSGGFTYPRGLLHAVNYTYPQLVNNASGTPVENHTTGSVAVVTEAAKLRTIANVLAACVNSQGTYNPSDTATVCGKLFDGVNATKATPRPSDTLQAALQMARYPYYNVAAVYGLISPTPPFGGALATAPNDWTVAISYTTAAFQLGIAQNTSSTLDIDRDGNIWIPNNKKNASGLLQFDPSAISFNGPYAGSTLRYPQYVELDKSTYPVAYGSDQASNTVAAVSTNAPSSFTTYLGLDAIYSTGGPVAIDPSNNTVYVAGNSSAAHAIYTVTPGQQTLNRAFFAPFAAPFSPSAAPNALSSAYSFPGQSTLTLSVGDTTSACNLEVNPTALGNYGTLSTGDSLCVVGGITTPPTLGAYMTASNNTLCQYVTAAQCTSYNAILNSPKALVSDGTGNLWVANAGNGSVATFTLNPAQLSVTPGSLPYLHGPANGGTLTTPYGIGVDGSGNVWVSNASCVSNSLTRCTTGSLTLTEIVGAASPTVTPASTQPANPQPGYPYDGRPTN